MATSLYQVRTEDNAQRHLIMISACILIVLGSAIAIQLNPRCQLEYTYYAVAAAIVLSSFTFLHQPFVTLSLTLVYLISPAPMILPGNYSAAITLLLTGNCFAGYALASDFRSVFEHQSIRIPLVLCPVAAIGAAIGIARGNQASTVMGDCYQLFEFAALWFLTRRLVNSEEGFQALIHVIIGTIVATSVLEMTDAFMGAKYLSGFSIGGIDLSRTINMNAPIAFVVLLATLQVARNTKWTLAGIGIIAINLLWSFTRGLWIATALSSLFLVLVQRGNARRALLKFVLLFSVVAFSLLYASGLGSIVMDRISFTAEQLDSSTGTDEAEQTLAGRRVLEYVLILPRIVEHPVLGNGLGATFEISGNAILQGPKDETVDHHYIHNLYLLLAFRLGIPILLISIVALWKYFRRALRNLHGPNLSPSGSALMAGLIAAVFGEVVLSVTSPTLLNHPTAGVLGCIMAVTTTTLHRYPTKAANIPRG